VTLEEQKSSRDRIQKLFARASKNLTKKPGYPEFIIGFTGKPDLLLLVECKVSADAHQSPKKWLHNFGRCNEWNLCLTAGTVVPANQERP
jgi:hypothetical protein